MKVAVRKRRWLRSSEYDGLPVHGWSAVAAHAVGLVHKAHGRPCEDYALSASRGSTRVIALADGAGSAAYASVGARVVVHAVSAMLIGNLRRLLAMDHGACRAEIHGAVMRSLAATAGSRSIAVDQLACTLLFAASDGSRIVLGQIGDGRIGVRDPRTGQWSTAVVPTRGEFANETCFVTSRDAIKQFQMLTLSSSECSACILMSDGAEASLYDRRRTAFVPAVDTLTRWLARYPVARVERAMRDQLKRVLTTRTHDDVSVALLVNSRPAVGRADAVASSTRIPGVEVRRSCY